MRIATPGRRRALALCTVIAALGCGSSQGGREPRAADELQQRMSVVGGVVAERKIVRSGELTVSVSSPAETAPAVEHLVTSAGGFVERSTTAREADVWMRCRVPAASLDAVMDAIEALGDPERRSVSAADVSEQVADLESRLRSHRALRDRLEALLARAEDVEDVLAIEKELNRLQVEIERMQTRFDRLETDVALSSLSVRLERRQILGPLGYVGYGVWWLFSKLFVIR